MPAWFPVLYEMPALGFYGPKVRILTGRTIRNRQQPPTDFVCPDLSRVNAADTTPNGT